MLEVSAPRNVVYRPPATASGSASASAGGAQPQPSSGGGAADARSGPRDGKRFFFWLQQEFCPDQRYPPGDTGPSSYFSSPPSGATSPSGSTSGADASDSSGSNSSEGKADSSGSGASVGSSSGVAVTVAGTARTGGAGYPSWRGRSGGNVGEMGGLALARRLQDLMELPPEFDPHKQSNRVRCVSWTCAA